MLLECTICREAFEGRAGAQTCSVKCRMAKSRGRGTPLKMAKIGRPAAAPDGSCVPIAISQATGRNFDWLIAELNEHVTGHKRKGYHRRAWEPVITKLGFVEVKDAKGKLCDQMPLDPRGIYLAVVREHMFCVKDGRFLDTWKSMKRRKRLRSLWLLK